MHTISHNGIKLITSFEGCRLTAYDDMQPNVKITSMNQVKGTLTIGYGHTGADVHPGMIISQSVAEELLKKDLKKFERNVEKYDPIYNFTQNEADALISFAYNVGSIDQLTNKGKRTKKEIYEHITEYNRSGEKVLSGLTRRRQAEAELFSKDGLDDASAVLPTLKKGNKGIAVLNLQRILISKGYLPIGSDDQIFGSKTFEAVKAYQCDHELTVDGIVGKNTWRILNE